MKKQKRRKDKANKEGKVKGRATLIHFLVLTLLMGLTLMGRPEGVKASEWDSAYSFYNAYGGNAVFHAWSETDGGIYFGSSGYTSSSGTKYASIGWKMVIRNQAGAELQDIYFALGGNYLKCISTETVKKYKYNLYCMSLSTVKARMNSAAIEALNAGNCSITLDSCMVIKKNGNAKGGMTDSGPAWGSVYTTYDGICSAANWSAASRTALLSYFGKSVSGLFYRVETYAGPGIGSTAGSGTYCYGTLISIAAYPSTGYLFSSWNGNCGYDPFYFYVTGNSGWTAYGTAKTTMVTFYRNRDASDTVTTAASYSYTGSGQSFPQTGWDKPGYHQLGWSENRYATAATYSPTCGVSAWWINAKYPWVGLYAVWAENTYTIAFDGNSHSFKAGMGISNRSLGYSASLTLPGTAMPADFLGWCLNADGSGRLYQPGQSLSVAELAAALGLQSANGATVRFYAIWDEQPAISAGDQYYGIDFLQRGLLTEEKLASHASAYDPQDGSIAYGVHASTSFTIKNYRAISALAGRSLTESEKKNGFSVPITFEVCDSNGHKVQKTVSIHFADTGAYTQEEEYERIRFISAGYLRGPGGLDEDSVWFTDPQYYALLKQAGLTE